MTIRGVTGDMNTGKTYFCTHAQKAGASLGIAVGVISGDDIRRYIISHSSQEQDIHIRMQLIKHIGAHIVDNNVIDRITLGNTLFTDTTAMQTYEQYVIPRMRELIQHKIQQENYDILLIEWAGLLENNMQDIVENNIILMICNNAIQHSRSANSDIPYNQVYARYSYFRPTDMKQQYCLATTRCHIINTTDGLNLYDIKLLLPTLLTHA